MSEKVPKPVAEQTPSLEQRLGFSSLPKFFHDLIMQYCSESEVEEIIAFEKKFQTYLCLPAMDVEIVPQSRLSRYFVSEYRYTIPQNRNVIDEKIAVVTDAFDLISALIHKRTHLLAQLSKKYQKAEGSPLFRAVFEKFSEGISQILYLQSIVEQNKKVVRDQEKRVKNKFDELNFG